MNDDLISRSALKKAVENLVVGGEERLKEYYENGSKSEENEWIGGVYDAWELIISAPTVEQSYQAPKDYIKNKLDYSRPQGEWKDHSEDEGYVECPICNHLTNCDGNIDELHYCWNCGADMRGGRE